MSYSSPFYSDKSLHAEQTHIEHLLSAKSKKFKNNYDTAPTLKLSSRKDEHVSA